MQPVGIMIDSSKCPYFEEGAYYEFPIFERTAQHAAQLTPSIEGHESCVDITVYFRGSSLMFPAHLHIDQAGDHGFMDWVGNAMQYANPEAQAILGKINRTLN